MYGIGLQLTSTTIIGGSYSPTSLFAANEPGVWFDNNDAANLNWRYNLLTFSEQFDNAVWTKQQATVTANSAIAPDGSTTADTVVALATLAQHRVDQATTITAGTYTFSCYAKATGYNFAWLRIGTGPNVIVSLADGSMTGLVGGTATAVNVGNGWWRIALSGAALASSVCRINVSSDSAASDFTGDGTSGILIWGAQLELGSTATAYQPITDVTTEVRERFPNATLYQDTAGTLPVTTPGQSVALALDKSRGLALGSELTTNGDFSNGTTGWSSQLGATLTAANGGMRVTGQVATAFSLAFQIVSANLNNALEITWTATVETLGSTNPRVGVGTIVRLFSTSGQYRMIVPGNRADNKIDLNPGTDGVVLFDNISVRELAGNHATQATTASRPLYALLPANGVRNLANRSADVGNVAYWPAAPVMAGITATKVSSGFDTDGLPYVDVRYQGTATDTFHDTAYISSNSRMAASTGQQWTASAIFTRVSGSLTGVTGARVWVVEETAPSTYVTQTNSASVATDTAPTTITATHTVTTGNQVRLGVVLNFTNTATIDVTFRIKALQFELGPTRTAYQFNYAATNIAEPPFSQVGALLYDGVDDFMVTPAINFQSYTWDGLARRNFALGSAQPANEAFWNGTLTSNGVTATKVASGFDTDGLPYADYAVSGTASAISILAIYPTLAENRTAASSGQTWTGSFITRKLVGGVLPALCGVRNTVVGESSIGVLTENVSAAITDPPAVDTVLTGTITLANAATTLVHGQVDIRTASGATVSYTVRIKALQLEQGTARTAWQGTGTDKVSVFAGVRKTSDAAVGTLVELSAAADSGTGGFFIRAPTSAGGANYQGISRGTITVFPTIGGISSPDTSVLTLLGDISGDSAILRRNGVVGSNAITDQGTGNYQNAPIYFGARAGTSLFFRGYMYEIIARGALTEANLLARTETSINQQTGAY